MCSNTYGYQNIALGLGSLATSVSGCFNIGIGSCTGGNGLLGNIYMGYFAGRNNGGNYNFAIGQCAMYGSNLSAISGCHNIAMGYKAGFSLCSASVFNIAIGCGALCNACLSCCNHAFGVAALQGTTTGNSNTAVGWCAGLTNTYGNNNTFLGNSAFGASATSCNAITLGNSSIATIRAQVTTITALSDCRDKTNICGLPIGLEFIRALRPVKFDWNMRTGEKVGIPESGFIAQELDEVQTRFTATDYLNLILGDNPDRLEAAPGKLLPVLVQAVKELADEVDRLRALVEPQ
jgi:hypothetical protein